jgi:hypothetical protein
MDDVEILVTQIAERVAPDEVDLAPELLAASVAGRPLEDRAGVAHGAFDAAAAVSMLRIALEAIRDNAILIKPLLEVASGALALAKTWQGMRQREPVPVDEIGRQTLAALDRIEGRLRAQGIDADAARSAARDLVATMLESPDAARALVGRFARA